MRTFHALGREILADAGVDVRRLVDRAELLTRIHGRPVPPALLRRLDDAFSRLTLDPDSAMAGADGAGPVGGAGVRALPAGAASRKRA